MLLVVRKLRSCLQMFGELEVVMKKHNIHVNFGAAPDYRNLLVNDHQNLS
jgi:hypothetical protein